jgi:hypothetical protein
MFTAAFGVLEDKAPDIGSYAESEFKKIAETLRLIESELAAGQVTADQAKILLQMQTSATRSVLLTSAGLSLLAAEAAINAALKVVQTVVNGALKLTLI